MVHTGTRVSVVDNSGALLVSCIRVLKESKKNAVALGQAFVGSVKKNELKEKKRPILCGDICKALVVLTKSQISRLGNCYIAANACAIVLVSTDTMPVGNRITSPIFIEIRSSKYSKVFAIADLFV
jgi:large subunit ribosomal protein L14